MQFYDEYKAAWNVDDSSTVTESMYLCPLPI